MPNASEPERPFERVLTLLGRMKPAYIYWTVVLVVFVTAVAIFSAAKRTSEGATAYSFLDSVVRAASLFVVSLDVSTLDKPIGIEVYVVAVAAAIVAFVGTLAVFVRGVREWVRLSLQTLDPRRRAVLLGFGRVNRAVARSLRRQGFQVTVGDVAFDDGARRLASRHRLLLVATDLSDPDGLEALQLDKSDRVVVALGNDIANVELGAGLIRPGGPMVFVHTADVQLASSLRQLGRDGVPFQRDAGGQAPADALMTGGGWVFSLKEEGARRLMARAQLPLLARAARQDRVHLVIFGFGDQGRAVLLEALLDCTATGLAPPAVTVVDRDADARRQQFIALRPRLMEALLPPGSAPDIAFLAADIDRLDMATDATMAAIEARGRPTAYIVTCGEDAINLDAGLRLEQAMRRSHRVAVPIYLAQAGTGLDTCGPLARRRPGLLRTFGSLDEATAEAPLVDDDPDWVPRQLHDAYNAQAIGSGILEAKYARSWEELSETMRESNRRAVRHARTKLLDLGLRWRGSAQDGLPVLSPELAARFAAAESALRYGEKGVDLEFDQPTEEGRLMAMSVHAEHRRWLVDRALDDWTQAPDGRTRIDQRRQHINMVPFADLTAANKRFDAMFIRGLLQYRSLPTAKGPLASLRTHAALFIGADAATPAIDSATTDLSLGWSNSLTALGSANAGQLVERIKIWSAGPAASRCIVFLAHPAPGRKQTGLVAMADVLNRIMLAVDPLVVLEVVHAYDPGISELDPGMPDEALRMLLENHE